MPINLTKDEITEIQHRYNYLLNYGGDDPTAPIDPISYVDSNDDHLIHIAAQRGDVKTIELLIRAGQDVNQTGDMSCTALHYAYMKGRLEIVELLLAHGADKNMEDEFGKKPGE
ncbi:ankyrin repeat domain-containing protein [Rhodanobacter sp. MP1X3]|uniref:ankyrin repeat domain-containing protein n=1 Tax=Rhodanobacter sp. MP1X3 TaxID=2723086 RepID=UPI0017A812F0|nr:ankyrin repeat domain-containing protein [Rhodanobacter sp. MP1X3]MBB6241256.1 hypothetical protein [Rhodanobacter sp. MP1X3]